MKRVLGYITKGIEEGAKLECGGKRRSVEGYFVEPTVFSNVKDNMTIAREEVKNKMSKLSIILKLCC